MTKSVAPNRKLAWRRPTLREVVLLSCLFGFGLMFLGNIRESLYMLWLPGLLLPSFVVFADGCVHLPHKKWTISLWCMTVRPLVLLIVFFMISQPPLLVYNAEISDAFAVELKIPTDIPLTDARGTGHANKPTSRPASDFDITQDTQPGIYQADIQIHLPTAGNVYLRAYEITKGTRLSSGVLKQRTLKHFAASSEQDDTERYQSKFTIFEGVWGQPYAARFEVWLIPADNSPEIKLKEKNFIIEGWML